MPAIPHTNGPSDLDTLRVLVTGFGPFANFPVNPAWLAVKPLHNTMLSTEAPIEPVMVNSKIAIDTPSAPKQAHITTVKVPVTYKAVLDIVPGLHARPPILPSPDDPLLVAPLPPLDGYDLILHVGVAPPGPLRLEKQAPKLGYSMRDVDGDYAPIVLASGGASQAPSMEGLAPETQRILAGGDLPEKATRGFGQGYEEFPNEFLTDIDVDSLHRHLKKSGFEHVRTSTDPGTYLCGFIYYCSLSEAARTVSTVADTKKTRVLFLHCSPIDQPVSTEDVTRAIKEIVLWVCDNTL